MEQKKRLPLGVQDFEKLRDEDFLYIDKTALIFDLVNNNTAVFLSRPRRFGKSLLLSTLRCYFLGQKELFTGLAIEEKESEQKEPWIKYPVMYFSLASGEFTQEDGLRTALQQTLFNFEKDYDLPHDEPTLTIRFQNALKNAFEKTGRRVVVLVDEYDNPLLKNMDLHPEQEQKNRELYKAFFATLKDYDRYLRFYMFTGVTKFSKVSIFSDLNQLSDISLDNRYGAICGITQGELETGFSAYIDDMAAANNLTRAECLARLKEKYDGYHFTRSSEDIYNPFSLINAFDKKEFGRYWFGTGTPTFLVERLKKQNFNPQKFTDGSISITGDEISDYRSDNPDLIPLLYQSGYLTIKRYDERRGMYWLGFPNDEVKYGFLTSLAPVYIPSKGRMDGTDIFSIADDIDAANTDSLRDRFTALFASLPYSNNEDGVIEQNFQNVVYIVFMLLGQFVRTEIHSAKGRADCILETDDYIYIFEFKRDGSALDALAQIEAQGYTKPFAGDKRKLLKIGVNFSSTEKNITEWVVK